MKKGLLPTQKFRSPRLSPIDKSDCRSLSPIPANLNITKTEQHQTEEALPLKFKQIRKRIQSFFSLYCGKWQITSLQIFYFS